MNAAHFTDFYETSGARELILMSAGDIKNNERERRSRRRRDK